MNPLFHRPPLRPAASTLRLALLLSVAIPWALAQADPPAGGPYRRPRPDRSGPGRRGGPQSYSLEQAVSDEAQLHTIAFDGLAFLTGDFGAATFLPPGKVCDFFGFQYLRDIDAAGKGHNPQFLDRIAGNVLRILDTEQRVAFAQAAREEAVQLRQLAERRLPLIHAFYRELAGDRPAGSRGLDSAAVARHTGELFALDAAIAYRRAELFGRVAAALTPAQRAELGRLKFGDFNTWPAVDREASKLPRGTEKLVNVAYMTCASEFFSWYAGSVEADTYFCPERHGTYFGGFYLKDMPAMGKRDFDISMALTGDSGAAFLRVLTTPQRRLITALPDQQRAALQEIVSVRRAIATELRRFLQGQSADRAKVLALGRRYGELDGELAWRYATAFAAVGRSLSAEQRRDLAALRHLDGYTSAPAYLFSDALPSAPASPGSDAFFTAALP